MMQSQSLLRCRQAAYASRLVAGNGMWAWTTQGSEITAGAVARVERLVADANAKGARLEIGSGLAGPGSLFIEPTLLAGVEPDMIIAEHEIFCPVAAIAAFADEREVMVKVNGTSAGLSPYFFTQDLGRARSRSVRNSADRTSVANDFAMAAGETPRCEPATYHEEPRNR